MWKTFEIRYKQIDLIVIISVFLVGLFIRLINLRYGIQVDELRWVERGLEFINALVDLKFGETFITYHPGVTAIYLTGLVQLLFPENLDILASVRLPFCIFGSATCSLIYLMGKSMFNRERGLIAAVLLTFEPFYIGITRIVHLDGLLAFFFTLTLYFFWLGITHQNQKYFVFSGVSLGLAVLTKSPAIFLIPILVVWILLLKNNGKLSSWQSIQIFVITVLIGGLTFYILWPGIWDLFGTLNQKLEYLIFEYEIHYQRHGGAGTFFLGSIHKVIPFYFYPIMLLVRLSTGVLICFIISIVLYANKLRKKKPILKETLVLLVLVIFIIGLSIFGTKFDRYLIPIWPVLMLTSSGGFQIILNSMREFFNSIGHFKHKQLAPPVILGFVIVFPAAFWSVNYQPFYVFYFNDFVGGLKGGSQITLTYTSEGSRLVAEYLSSKSDNLVVACAYFPSKLAYFYEGNVTKLPHSINVLFEQYDYVVFHLTYIQRTPDDVIWQHFKDKNPEYSIIVQDVTVVWVFNLK